jgi:hypothetical protein
MRSMSSSTNAANRVKAYLFSQLVQQPRTLDAPLRKGVQMRGFTAPTRGFLFAPLLAGAALVVIS